MSAPTRQLGKLSIGGSMPTTTRSQARRAGQVPYHRDESSDDDSDDGEDSSTDDSSSEDDGDDSDSQASSSVVRGRSTISYDLRQLSGSSRARAISGLTAEYAVQKCRSTRNGFEFQVFDQGRVQVGQGPLTCSCVEHGRSMEACRHVFWLVDQLYRSVLPGRPSNNVPLSNTGESPRFPPLHQMIGDNMEEISRNVNWPYSQGTGSPASSNSDFPPSMSRSDKARDILSAFSETTLPEEFRPDLVETIGQPRTPEECVVQGDFEATMFRLAAHDENVYMGLRRAMPAGARAAIFFDKVQRRCNALLADFDRYCQTGAPRPDGTVPEIDVVVAELVKNVGLIQKNIQIRSPHGTKGATEVLVELLRNIVGRNYDAFEGNTWGRVAPPGETSEDRNLFAQLICDVSDDEFFVLDALEVLPDETLSQWARPLDAVFDELQENGAPIPYLRKLHLIVGERGSETRGGSGTPPDNTTTSVATTGSSGHGHKRPATASKTSESKRLK